MKATPNRANSAGAAGVQDKLQPSAAFCQPHEVTTRPDREFRVLQAAFAVRGVTLHQQPEDDGGGFLACRWGLFRHLPTIEEARRFLAQIGGAA